MADSQDFHLIQIPRSDGQDTGEGYWSTDTAATATKPASKKTIGKDGIEKTPRAKAQMVRLAKDDPRLMEWQVKLGILLRQELSSAPHEGLPWCVELPRGYWLYEKSKHLWVSGYPVKSKLFKTPQEFGLHLLWLISGSNDPRDCCCVHCNPQRSAAAADDLSIQEPTLDTESSAYGPTRKAVKTSSEDSTMSEESSTTPSAVESPVPLTSLAQAQTKAPPVQVSSEAPAGAGLGTKAPAQTQKQATTARPKSETPVPVPKIPSITPTPTAVEQTLPPYNANVSSLFFRTGELVWYSVAPSWRIGLIAKSNPTTKQFDILPISHAHFNYGQLQPRAESALRPFLAFTVPPVNIPELGQNNFDSVPWDTLVLAFATDVTKRDRLLLDASKLAASKISGSFSLFGHMGDSEGGRKANYRGAFLGAERVEINDVLRVRVTPEQNLGQGWVDSVSQGGAILGLREICTASDLPGSVFFKGDLYAAITNDTPPPQGQNIVEVPADKLPAALREEFYFRGKFAAASCWRVALLRQNAVFREPDINGRFYPSNRLLPVLSHPNLAQLHAELQQGTVRDSTRQLNQRMDSFKDGYIGYKKNRMDVIGAAVPHGSESSFAFEPIVQEGL